MTILGETISKPSTCIKGLFFTRTRLLYLSSFFLELLNRSLVDATTLVDEVSCSGGLARVHMADHDYVDVELLLSHDVNSRAEVTSPLKLWLSYREQEMDEPDIRNAHLICSS